MNTATPKLNIWQEVHAVEHLNQSAQSIKNEAHTPESTDTWFHLLQYPAYEDNEPKSE